MAKTKSKPKVEEANTNRFTVLNLKGSARQRDWLASIARTTFIPSSRIARQALSEWAKERGHPPMPDLD